MRLPRLGLLPRVVLGLAAVALLPLAIAPFIIDLNRDAMTSQVLRTHAVAARSAAARVEAAIATVRGPAEALAMIEPLAPRLSNYFYFHGVRGSFLLQLGRKDEARQAFTNAISLANTAAEAAHIRLHLDRLQAEAGTSKK